MPKRNYDPDMLFSFYEKHMGDITAVANDPACPCNNRTTLTQYKFDYDWDVKLAQKITETNTKLTSYTNEKLIRAKYQAIDLLCKAIDEAVDPETGKLRVSVGDIIAICRYFRAELGLPERITFNASVHTVKPAEEGPELSLEEIRQAVDLLEDSELTDEST